MLFAVVVSLLLLLLTADAVSLFFFNFFYGCFVVGKVFLFLQKLYKDKRKSVVEAVVVVARGFTTTTKHDVFWVLRSRQFLFVLQLLSLKKTCFLFRFLCGG